MIIATLGEEENPFTCSYEAAVSYLKNADIQLFSSFEAAAEAVKTKKATKLIVPAAYPKINPLIMDEGLIAKESFIHTIPALVLAGCHVADTYELEKLTLFYHPATEVLISEIDSKYCIEHQVAVSSNSEACYKLLNANDKIHLALTNELCVAGFGLKILQVLRVGIRMPFVCFESIS
jgi:hypothetical protein